MMKLKKWEDRQGLPKKKRKLSLTVLTVYLVMAALMTTGISFARYITSVSGSSSARVAIWDFDATAAKKWEEITLGQGENGSVEFTVQNNGETAVEYDIVVTFPKELYDKAYVSLTSGGNSVSRASGETGRSVFTFPCSAGIGVGEQTFTLTISTDPQLATNERYQDVIVTVRSRQID